MGSSKSWTGLTSRQAAELATETVHLVESGDPLGDAAEAGNVELVEKLLKGRGIIFKLDATLLGKILKQLGESEAKKRSTTNGKPGFEHAHLGHSIATTLVGFLRVFGAVSSLFSCWILGYKLCESGYFYDVLPPPSVVSHDSHVPMITSDDMNNMLSHS